MSPATRQKTSLYLLPLSESEMRGNKLPSCSQVLKVFFYHHVDLKQTIRTASTAAVEAAIPFWERTKIPIRAKKHLITKLEKLHERWKTLTKTRYRQTEKQKNDEAEFLKVLDNFFDMAANNALQVMKIKEDIQFLLAQREGSRGTLVGVDKTFAAKQKRAKKRKASEENYRIRMEQPTPSHVDTNQISSSSTSGEETDEQYIPVPRLKPPDPKKP